MTTEAKRKDTQGPTDAEKLWFEASDRWFYLLERRGRSEALKAASEVLELLPPLPEMALRQRSQAAAE